MPSSRAGRTRPVLQEVRLLDLPIGAEGPHVFHEDVRLHEVGERSAGLLDGDPELVEHDARLLTDVVGLDAQRVVVERLAARDDEQVPDRLAAGELRVLLRHVRRRALGRSSTPGSRKPPVR